MSDTTLPKKIEIEPGVTGLLDMAGLAQHFAVETTLPQETQEERGRILRIIEGPEIKGQSVIGSEIYLGDYVMHPIPLVNDETGEEVEGIRTLLLQPDGDPVSFVATGILKSIARISWKERRNPPFNPPILVRLVQRATGKGRRTYKLIPVE